MIFYIIFQLSYQIVDSMIWLGIRDMINDFRKKKLKLRPVTYLSGAQGSAYDIPHGYIWSPHLVPKAKGPSPAHALINLDYYLKRNIIFAVKRRMWIYVILDI